jgi:glycosyltransferase involved in cell wall biosynthesis
MSKLHIAIASPIETSRFANYLKSSDGLPKGMGGTAVNHLILGLLKAGIKVSIYTLTPEINEPVIIEGEDLSIFYGPYRKKARFRIADLFRIEANNISKFAIKDHPNLIHAHWGYEYASGAIKSGLPHVITLRDSPAKVLALKKDIYRLARFLLHKKVLRNGKNFIVNSPYLNQVFNSNYPVIPNPIVQYDTPEKKEIPQLKIISILNGWGNIKNASKGIEAFALLRKKINKPIEYHLIGHDFGQGEIAQAWAKKHELSDDIVFRGAMDHENLIKELSEATIMLHPSKEESFGNVIAEALSVGIPVIGGRNAGAVPWLLDNGNRGILVDINSSEEICEAMFSLTNDTNMQSRYSELGRKFVEENLTQEVITKQHLKIYNQILYK